MEHLEVEFNRDTHPCDIATTIALTTPSLAGTVASWGALMSALQEEDPAAARIAAEKIVSEAVPEEGWPHPRRGTVGEVGGSSAELITPAGVGVTIIISDGTPTVRWEFARDSRVLAARVLATAFLYGGVLAAANYVSPSPEGAVVVPHRPLEEVLGLHLLMGL